MLNSARLELRTAIRGLARMPSVSLSAILCLSLGMGATAAIASAIDQALLQPLPFHDSARLVAVHRVTPNSGPQGTWPHSPANFLDLARTSNTVQSLSAVTFGTALVATGNETVQASALDVSGSIFDMLGAHAQLGRLITPDDDRLDHPRVAVLSDDMWRKRFSTDPSVVGRSVSIDGSPTTIIGVLPADFKIPHGGNVLKSDVWLPIRFTPEQAAVRNSNFLLLMGRLAPGATVASAEAELKGIFARLVDANPNLRGETVRAAALQAESQQNVRKPLVLLFAAVCLVLLIAATNVAALLLARGVHKRREMAVRVALGAGRFDAMRPALAESLLIALAGTIIGLGVAVAGVRTIGALAAARLPQLGTPHVDVRVIGFAIVLAVLVSLLCGIVPAWRSAAVDPQDAMRGGRGGGSTREHHRALRFLVIGEIALSLVLLVGAGLVLKAFAGLLHNDPGFETSHVVTMSVTVSATRYPNQNSARDFLEPALAQIRAVPGVEAAGAISSTPYLQWGNNSNIRYEGRPNDNPSSQPLVEQRSVTPGFFSVTKQRLLSGRLLTEADDDNAPPVTVVNEALVKRDFKNVNPVGRRFYVSDTSFATIVGVVSDIRNAGPIADPAPEMYWTYRQSSSGSSRFPLMVRTKGDPTAVVGAIRQAIHSLDATAAIGDVAPMPAIILRSLGRPRFYFSLLGTFAGVAVFLSLAGLYGVLSYAVAQRARELGIRVALGSSGNRLIRQVCGEGLRMVVVGIVVGLAASALTTRFIVFMLYGTSPLDSSTWALAAFGMLAAAATATLLPAIRASHADPVVAMRAE